MAIAKKIALLAAVLAASALSAQVSAEKSTVCTITVNSPDEKETFRRYLPEDKYRFVELVERGRPDWLASACRQHVRCDVLIISGHFNGSEFFSEHLDSNEYLPVDEMERASCSNSCPTLFSQLKEVYLFGCNTLNPESNDSASAAVERSLIRGGSSRADAQRVSRVLGSRHRESNRDGMRRIFVNVPVIYGFSSTAPPGAAAASTLRRYFQSGPSGEVGSGRTNTRLLGQFSANAMAATAGLRASEPQAAFRDDVCQFFDDRRSAAQTLRFIHRLLARDTPEVRMFLDRIERFAAGLSSSDRQSPEFVAAQDELISDRPALERYLGLARDADDPMIRARMVRLAQTLGWISPADAHAEIVALLNDLFARPVLGPAEVKLACSLDSRGQFDQALVDGAIAARSADDVGHAAALACLGSAESRVRVLRALTAPDDDGVRLAQVYLAQRPLTDAGELHAIAEQIARMPDGEAQARALDTLAGYHLSDRQSLEALVSLFSAARSVGVQRAVAGVLIRSNYGQLDRGELVDVLRRYRLKAAGSQDIIDALIRRLQA